jgi:hypothetical protein
VVAHDLGIPEADYIVHAANAYPKFVEMLKTISTGNGRLSVAKDLEAVLRKIEYWHQAPVIKFRIIARQGQGAWHGVRWDSKTAISFPLDERDETKAMQALLLWHPIEEAASPSDREIDTRRMGRTGSGPGRLPSPRPPNKPRRQRNSRYGPLRRTTSSWLRRTLAGPEFRPARESRPTTTLNTKSPPSLPLRSRPCKAQTQRIQPLSRCRTPGFSSCSSRNFSPSARWWVRIFREPWPVSRRSNRL